MSKKSKSPPSPSYGLEDLFDNTEILYGEFGRNSFNKEEIASTLGQSSTSGPFKNRFFSLRELGLIESADESGDEFKVSDRFIQMRTKERESAAFRRAAREAIESASVFQTVLEVYEGKLPSQDNVANRLESDHGFNPKKAQTVARVLEESMHFAGVLDENNNILPIREPDAETDSEDEPEDETPGKPHRAPEEHLTTEVPVGENEVVKVVYPQDLSAADAKKVGAVLAALVKEGT